MLSGIDKFASSSLRTSVRHRRAPLSPCFSPDYREIGPRFSHFPAFSLLRAPRPVSCASPCRDHFSAFYFLCFLPFFLHLPHHFSLPQTRCVYARPHLPNFDPGLDSLTYCLDIPRRCDCLPLVGRLAGDIATYRDTDLASHQSSNSTSTLTPPTTNGESVSFFVRLRTHPRRSVSFPRSGYPAPVSAILLLGLLL